MAKILFVTSNFLPPDSYNGVAITLVSLARALSRRGHDLTVLAAGHGAASRHRDRAGVEICLFPTTGEILRSLHANADALCVWHVGGQFPHPSLFKRRRTLSYIYVHALGLGNENGVVAVNGRLGGRVSYLANSGFTQRRLHAAFDLATPIVPIFTVPEDYRVDSARRHVLFVNPSRAKGGARVLAMARALPHIPFQIREGWGHEDIVIRDFRAAADALPNVTWLPATDDMRACYREAAVVLAPSLVEETWGRIVSEAQVSGIPALVSDRGALPETVAAGGVVMAADAPLADWCAALARMWDDRAYYDRLAAAARAAAMAPTRAPETVLDQWEALFRAAEA